MKYLLMDSEYCSMGRWISWIVAEEFNMKMYEAEDIAENIEWLGKEKLNNFYARIACMEIEDIKKDLEFIKIKEALTQKTLEMTKDNDCIIHEMCASEFISKEHEIIRVMLYCDDMDGKIKRARTDVTRFPGIETASKEEIIKHIELQDLGRSKYHDACSNKKYGIKENYDICINSALFGKEKSAQILLEVVK